MKKYLATRMRLCINIFYLCALVTIALVTPHLSQAQNGSEKIRLMADTLRARDSGNLDLAKEKAEELIKIAPKDDNVQRLLGAINKELDRRGGKVTSAGYGQANSQDVELDMELSSTSDARSHRHNLLRLHCEAPGIDRTLLAIEISAESRAGFYN